MRDALFVLWLGTGAVAGWAAAPPQTPVPVFEVASVKPNVSGDTRGTWALPPRGRVVMTNVPLRDIIARAYEIDPVLQRFILTGGPEALLSARFDINAVPPEDAVPGDQILRLRSLLADRFQLRIRTDTRQIPVYEVTVAREGRLGPTLQPSEHDCDAWRTARLAARAAGGDLAEPTDARGRGWCLSTYDFGLPGGIGLREAGVLSRLISRLQAFTDRPLVDATGLQGRVEWQVAFSMNPNPAIEADLPSLFTAVEEQLGLKLVPRLGPFDVTVIDGVAAPEPD